MVCVQNTDRREPAGVCLHSICLFICEVIIERARRYVMMIHEMRVHGKTPVKQHAERETEGYFTQSIAACATNMNARKRNVGYIYPYRRQVRVHSFALHCFSAMRFSDVSPVIYAKSVRARATASA